tara:strand:+ start:118 stop:441 length:324 start_codon:yes stop_codon:yes gene_type:complete
MRRDEATRGWCADESIEVDMCIVLDRQGDGPELEASEDDQMTDLLTAMHLSVMLLDLKIRMMEAISEERFDLAMTYHLLILVRQDELEAHKWAMSPKAWAIYETIHP